MNVYKQTLRSDGRLDDVLVCAYKKHIKLLRVCKYKFFVILGRKGMETSEASQIKIKICITSSKIINRTKQSKTKLPFQ